MWAQYLFDFETGKIFEWEQVPAGRWEVTGEEVISGSFSLHHSYDSPDAGSDFILITHDPPGRQDSLSLSFRIRHGYPPSAFNNWQVAFLADFGPGDGQPGTGSGQRGDFTGGILLGVNREGSDDLVKVWSCRDGQYRLLCNTSVNYQEQVGTAAAPCFRVTWYREGKLQIFFTADPDAKIPQLVGSCDLDTLPSGRQLVIRYGYSAGQDRKLWLDDIRLEGNFVADTLEPAITGVSVHDENTILLRLSEPVIIPEARSFLLTGEGLTDPLSPAGEGSFIPDEVTGTPEAFTGTRKALMLRFSFLIPNRQEMSLRVRNLCDTDGNCLSDTIVRLMRNEAVWGDVVINEVMCDPVPSVNLPGCEYLELFNRSLFPVDLEGWCLEINERSYGIGGMQLGPGEYGVLGGRGGEDLQVQRYVPLFFSGSALPNEGATIALYDRNGLLIHVVRYADPGTGLVWKREGGWSLESADPEQVCNTSRLWEYSEDSRGGTPGEENSIFSPGSDDDPPRLIRMGTSGKGSITLHFSELIRVLPDQMNRSLLMPSGRHPDSVSVGRPFFDHLTLHFPGDLPQRSDAHLVVPAVSDCSGNFSPSLKIPVGQLAAPRFSSVQINEVMYDPEDGAPGFIELHNPGDLFFDLGEMSLDVEGKGGPLTRLIPLWEGSRILSPGDFVVLSRNNRALMRCYGLEYSGKWLELKNLPALPNSGGTIYLADRSGNLIDLVHYDERMHMELLDDTKGISLERISAERPGTDPGNWHSAASIEGYSTPGKKNSQSLREGSTGPGLVVEPTVFSPDHDGYEDFLQISVAAKGQGWVIRLWVTDLTGRMIRHLANNHIAGPVSAYTWDGEQDDGQMAEEGIYVIHLRGYHPLTGDRFNGKRAAGIIYR